MASPRHIQGQRTRAKKQSKINLTHEDSNDLQVVHLLTPRLDRIRDLVENSLGRREVNTSIGNRHAVLERGEVGVAGVELLLALVDVRLDHEANDALVASSDLLADLICNLWLVGVELEAVSVAAVDHDPSLKARLLHELCRSLDVLRRVVWSVIPASKDDVGTEVALGVHNSGKALLGDREERVCRDGRPAGINGDLRVAARGVLEANRAGEAGGQLAVDLALRGPRADRSPAYQVGEELWGDGVEELHAAREAKLVHLEEEFTAFAEALVDLEGPVHVRVVDEALPAHGGPRLLKVHAHDDQHVARDLFGHLGELPRVLAA
mmetsp:Transcript_22751/g.72900  ORF Transcript_22751/g.72900 Transcript_22751/m.72900 type:complete len:323 (+) Transcript_22751:100-1068(+)